MSQREAAVLAEVDDAVGILTFNRPDSLNALDQEVITLMSEIIPRFEADEAIRAIVLRGAGGHFMSGGDIKMFHGLVDAPSEQRRVQFEQIIHQLHVPLFALRRMPKPVVASVHGACVGVGLSFAMASDLVVAAQSSVFSLAYCLLGTSPDGSSTYSLPRIVGLRKAMELALLGDRFDATEAARLGLVNRVVDDGDLEGETLALARRLAQGPTFAYGRTKALLNASFDRSHPEQLLHEAEAFAECASGDDFAEGVKAFVEKRPARFRGR